MLVNVLDEVSLQGDDPLDDLLLGVLGGPVGAIKISQLITSHCKHRPHLTQPR